jgi:hypothetical protein
MARPVLPNQILKSHDICASRVCAQERTAAEVFKLLWGLLGRRKPKHKVFASDGDEQIDLFPIAEEVIALAPHPCGMDALRLAEIARERFTGHYIRVGEYPSSIDREYAKLIVGRVVSWARWKRKEKSFKRLVSFQYEVRTGHQPCKRMRELSGKVIGKDELQRLPLDDCWQKCQCWYSVHRK